MPATNHQLLNKLCEIENALNNYSSDALFLAMNYLRKDEVKATDLEQLFHLLTDCQNAVNKIINDLQGGNDE